MLPTRSVMAAMALVIGVAADAPAQLGGLKKLKDKVEQAGKTNDNPDMVRATATLDYTMEWTASKRVIATPERAGDNTDVAGPMRRVVHYAATGVLSLSPQALPGGPLARAAAAVNPLYVL